MGTDRLRLALTVSLSFACAALGAAEAPLLPEVAGCAVVVILLLATLYQRGGRVEVLSIPAANRLGGAMGMVWLGWAAVRVVREVRRAEFTGLGWPVFVVCLFGMLILGLIPAKLLRREKHAGDYWWLLGLGLGAAALAGAMADDAVGFGLLAGYTVAGVWAVAEFHAARSAGRVAPMPGAAAVRVAVKLADRSVRLSLPLSRPLLWAALAAAVAAPLYLVTPRSPFGNLSFVKERVEIGYAADQMVNLNRTGDLKANPEEAFTVVAADAAGRPVDDLDTATRWRGAVLTHYERGGWRRDEYVALPAVEPRARYALQWRPPDFGPDRLRLTFAVPADLRSEFLADPVYWEAGRPVPVADLTPRGPAGWFAFPDGSFVRPPGSQEDGSLVEYVQYTRRGGEPDLGPPVFLTGLPDRVFVTSPVPRVKEYADAVVRAGVAAGRLPAPLGTVPAGVPLPPVFHEVVAREFARHLSDHPELRYTTAVRRGNPDLDPVEDFLDQTKAGHCERFASALVLMLRSQGIPSVLVLGFKGCEGVGGGRYVVRQEHAHVWAEALVARPAPRGFPANRVYHWLSLDPSPAELSDPPAPPAGLLGRVRSLGRETVGKYLTDYTPERRDEALRGTWAFARRPEVAGGAAAAVLLGLGVWAVRRRLARRVVVARPTGWYGDLLAVLAAHGYLPADGQTPREFAAAVAGELHADPATAPVAGLPPEWTARYYGERFGGRPAPAEFRTQAPGRLLLLAAALDSRRNRR